MSFRDDAPSYQQTIIDLLAEHATTPLNEIRAIAIVESLIENGCDNPGQLYAVLACALTKVGSLTNNGSGEHVPMTGAMLKSVATVLDGFVETLGWYEDDGTGGFNFHYADADDFEDDHVDPADVEWLKRVEVTENGVTNGVGALAVPTGTPEAEVRRLIAENLGIPEDAIQELRQIS